MQRPACVGGQAWGHGHTATGAGGRRSINRASRTRVWSGHRGSTGPGNERTGSDPGSLPQTSAGMRLTCRGARPPCRGQGGGLQRGRSLRTPSKLNTRWGHTFSHGCDRSGWSKSGRRCPRGDGAQRGAGAKQLGTVTGHLPGTGVEHVLCVTYMVWTRVSGVNTQCERSSSEGALRGQEPDPAGRGWGRFWKAQWVGRQLLGHPQVGAGASPGV